MRPPRPAREVDRDEGPIVVRERGRAVGEPAREIGPHPVEHGHEVVAQHRDAEIAHRAHARAVPVDQPVARGPAQLDILMHGDALHDGEAQAGVLDLGLEGREPIAAPGLTDRHVVEGTDHAPHPGDLADVAEWDGVRRTEPAKGRDHEPSSSTTSPTLARLTSPGAVSLSAPAITANSSASAAAPPSRPPAISAAATLPAPPPR